MKAHTFGTMVMSLDLELSWGRFDKMSPDVLTQQSMQERACVKRLLALLDEYEVPATWAVTGHLMLDECARGAKGLPHEDLAPRPAYSWFGGDWYRMDPCTKASDAPCWYAPDIVEWITRARAGHEVGSHAFAHIYYGDPETTAETAEADLQAAVMAAKAKGVTLRSFVFPRNLVGHLPVLRRAGLIAFRGSPDPLNRGNRGLLKRGHHFLKQLLGCAPMNVFAEETLPGLWNIPGNHFFIGREGLRKAIPMASRVLKGMRGIDRAVKNGGLYHLWLHPFNLIADSDNMFRGLERILAHAREQRRRGALQILTMEEYARALQMSYPSGTEAAFKPGTRSGIPSSAKRNRQGLRLVNKRGISANR
jgi:peptidoglycan/xylan/chitin deacetylase (PgdA/CDA1 family)